MTVTNRPPEQEEVGLYADDLFDEVVHLPPAERDATLVARCGADQSLLREVRALLAAHDAMEPSVSRPRPADPPELLPGSRLGPWRLAERLGKGASASVWKAFDHHLETWSALKVVHPRPETSGRALDAVMSEARAASRIISDHVVRVKRAGRLDQPGGGDLHYIEMELCAEHRARADGNEELVVGASLADSVPTDPRECARLVMEAARGVDAAHRIGVLHRDLKPANILVTPVSRRALVADFGLSAPQLYPAPTPDTPSTATVTMLRPNKDGVLVGTPSFMAPEQAFGHPHSRVADVYGLGATLYTLLAGGPPYQPRPGAAIPALDVVTQVQESPPAPLRRVAPRVPARLARIVERAMARSPRQRYPTAAALADDLQLYLEDRPTSVDGLDPLLRAGLLIRRNRVVATATALLSLVLLIFSGAVWQLEQTRQEIEAEMRFAQAHRDEAEQLAAAAERRAHRAEEARQEAISDARAALEARDRALAGAEEADQRAQYEISQRWAAEQAKVQAEKQLAGETDLRMQMQAALRVAQERSTQERLAREWIETVLEDETQARLRAEHERDETQRALEEADLRISQLESEIAQLRAALRTATSPPPVEEAPEASPPTSSSEPDEIGNPLSEALERLGISKPSP